MYDVVIPCLYEVDGDYLKVCVESLRASGFENRIIVVTNGTPTIPDLTHIQGISQHLHTRDQGQCNAVNIGAQSVDAEYMLISNADMYYAQGWDKSLELNCPVFSPNLIEPTNNLGSAPPFLKLDAGYTLEEFKPDSVRRFIALNRGKEKHRFESGFNFPLFIRMSLWKFLGGYDTAYDPWGSNGDTDLQTRIDLAGVTPVRVRDVLVYHFSNKSGTFNSENDAYRINNFEYFKEKFGFDRDELHSDVWYNKDMIPKDKSKIKYKQAEYND